jgi:hypothetical protein
LSIPTSPSFAFGTGDLTIECWFYPSAAQSTGANIICVTNGSAFGIVIHNNLTAYPNVVTFWCDTYSAGPFITGTTSLVVGNWYHFALTRSGGVWRMYINGIQQGSNYTNAASPDRGAGYNLRIGGDNNNANRIFNGYIQDLRFTKSVARYITNFAVPVLPFGTSGPSAKVIPIEYLVVAGGGGGANGGGGAGGYLTSTVYVVVVGTPYIVTVGAGGPGTYGGNGTTVLPTVGTNGTSSVFATITAAGGGLGGYYTTVSGITGGAAGGSGGGAPPAGGGQSRSGGAGNTPTTTPSQGNSGGNNFAQDGNGAAGGGGGAGAVGAAGSSRTGGAGGIGLQNGITGTSTYYAGGGGGFGVGTRGLGGAGGGGDATTNAIGTSGNPNTGGGGGAVDLAQTAGGGGSGVVIIAYPSSFGILTNISSGLTYTIDITTRPEYIVYRFINGTGTISF